VRISIILAHPNPASLNHAIANAVADELTRAGHTITFHDLHRERFDPNLPAAELASDAPLPPEIAAHCREVALADGLVIVHPNWWGQPPAILKGWIDRVPRAGVAYRFIEGDNGEGIPIGLLRAKAAVVLNTANTPRHREEAVFGDPLEAIWKKCIFDLCGVMKVERRMFRVIVGSTDQMRAGWLQEARELVVRTFPPVAASATALTVDR
jgi:putative NADPH-quinone reductase